MSSSKSGTLYSINSPHHFVSEALGTTPLFFGCILGSLIVSAPYFFCIQQQQQQNNTEIYFENHKYHSHFKFEKKVLSQINSENSSKLFSLLKVAIVFLLTIIHYTEPKSLIASFKNYVRLMHLIFCDLNFLCFFST